MFNNGERRLYESKGEKSGLGCLTIASILVFLAFLANLLFA